MHVYTLSDYVEERLRTLRAGSAWSARVRAALIYLQSGMREIISELPDEAYIASLLDPCYLDTFIPPRLRNDWWNALDAFVRNMEDVAGGDILEVKVGDGNEGNVDHLVHPQAGTRSMRSANAQPTAPARSYVDLINARFEARGAAQAAMKPYRDLAPVKVDPTDWWRQNEGTYPLHAKLAKIYLAIPASSASCERLFSVAGNVLTKRRASLSPESTQSIVYVHEHLDLLDCIDLDVVHYSDG